MGELLQHDILASLNNTSNAWLVDLLEAFNSGNINLFQSTASQWQSQSDLKVT
jgi:26S proteasome regulatory subunit N9